jgi:hypothetical protein
MQDKITTGWKNKDDEAIWITISPCSWPVWNITISDMDGKQKAKMVAARENNRFLNLMSYSVFLDL